MAQADKKKLQTFHNDLLKISCVKGFRYFAMHIRGKEEMICSIVNEPTVPILLSAFNSPASSFTQQNLKDSLPRNPDSFMLSHKLQRKLSGYGGINVGLPPASPSEGDLMVTDENNTMFLIAAYGRYNRPYVWVRSNHKRLIGISDKSSAEKDYPLQLKSTTTWIDEDVKVWDIVAELVRVCTIPAPPNPFAIDFDYYESLPVPEKLLSSGAMVNFLRRLLQGEQHSYTKRVRAELLQISQIHFGCLVELYNNGRLQPPLENNSQVAESRRSRSRPASARMAQLPIGDSFRTQY
ncbi:uncharacterized protein [Dysidea avara]|uniref:uncharacterized protein isoform X2 n=1 Tax=Dysidea avara TaxID=196820 RepID=UPI0033191660